MLSQFGLRTFWALSVVVIAAAGVLILDQSVQGALITLVGGAAAALVGAGAGEHEAAPVPEPAPARPDPLLGEVLDAIVEPVLLVRTGRVTLANKAARTLLGGHIVGEDVRIAIRHPAAAERLASPGATLPDRPINLVGLGTLDQRWEMRIGQASDGQRIVHLIDQTGNYAAERMRVDFVANASHELRTPLASILGFIETLGDEAGGEPEIRARFLKVMFDEARRMQRLVEDLISLSRIEAEKYRLPTTAVDLTKLIDEVRSEIEDAADVRACDIIASIDPAIPPVSGDRVQLSQMLHNLIGNAIKYGRPGTPVTISLIQDGGMVRLSVADEGEGIAPEHIPRLTERFYRIDAGRSRAMGGTGLGLAIVKHIVERHRGRLDIASTVGKGTSVTIVLPPSEPPSSIPPHRAMSSKGNDSVTQPRG